MGLAASQLANTAQSQNNAGVQRCGSSAPSLRTIM
jgi:hypothetical protein